MNIKSTVLLCTVLFLFFIIPAQAAEQGFTVYGQVFDTGTPVNGVNVSLSISLGAISNVTNTVTQTNGTPVNGYYYLDLANLPGGVPSAGTSMTLTASYNGKSASKVVTRDAAEPQRVDLNLSTSSTATSTVSVTTSTGGGGGGTISGASNPTVSGTAITANPTVLVTEIPPTETTTTPAPAATTKSPGFEVIMVVAVLLTLHIFRRRIG